MLNGEETLNGDKAIPKIQEFVTSLMSSPQGKAQEDGVVQEALVLTRKKLEE